MDNTQPSTPASRINEPKYTTDHPRRMNSQMVQNVLLIWLDRNIDKNTADCQSTITQLRRTVNSVNTFTDEKQCIEFLEDMDHDKACLIISGSLGQQIVPEIHNLAQVDTIFIFCDNKQFHETWTKNWSKIKGVFTEITPICEALKKTAQQCEQDSMPMSFVNAKDQIEPSFMYTTIIKEILLTINFGGKQIKEYINYCRDVFADNDQELENIDKFERERMKLSPVWWYTYECFLYRMLNRGLRSLDTEIINKMGFFIADLHQQIEELHKEQFDVGESNSQFVVYRGQGIAKTEFDKLQQTKGGLLSFNNFLSTSKKREVSMGFARSGAANPENVGILFVMTIRPDQSTTPFASIAHLSYFGPNEDEVLFAMNSIFRIDDIQPMNDNPGVFTVDLSLTTDNDNDLQILTERIREESFPYEQGWFRLGSVLYTMGQFGKAQQIYEMLLEQETVESEKAPAYHQLGLMKEQQGEYEEAITFYEKSISIEEKMTPLPHINLANSYNNIGIVYSIMNKYAQALSYFEKAFAIRQLFLPSNHPDLANSYTNIGMVYKHMGEYDKALSYCEKALAIDQQSLPSNHPDLAGSYNNIGLMYYDIGDNAKALSYYEKALTIRQQSLPFNHPELGGSYNNIGTVYENMKNYSKACFYYEKAVKNGEQSLPWNHPILQSRRRNLDRVKNIL